MEQCPLSHRAGVLLLEANRHMVRAARRRLGAALAAGAAQAFICRVLLLPHIQEPARGPLACDHEPLA